MSEASRAMLSREEIDAILASATEAAQVEESRVRRKAGATAHADFVWTPLARALREFGEAQARTLSALYQRTLGFTLFDLRSLPAADFAAAMIGTDSAVIVRFGEDAACGALLIGRTLLYGWLTLSFGGEVDSAPPFVPNRRPSRIESRFLARISAELVRQLEESLAGLCETKLEAAAMLEPELVAAHTAPRLLVASYDARGFGNVARLRVALPESLFDHARPGRAAARATGGARRVDLAERLQTMPLRVRAEVGVAELPLGRLRELRAGDVLPLRPASPGGVVVRVEDEAKFRGVPGVVGARLAVRITERM